MALLDVEDLSIRFGGILALDGVSFSVEKGEIFSIIGPNGAGKTTVFNCITRVYEPIKGSIRCNGRDLMGSYTRVMQLKTVVLPAPLGPMIEKISPFSTEKETPSSARIPPKRIERSSTSKSANRPPGCRTITCGPQRFYRNVVSVAAQTRKSVAFIGQ